MRPWKPIALTMIWGLGYLLLVLWEAWAVRTHLVSTWEIAFINTVYLIGGTAWLAWRS